MLTYPDYTYDVAPGAALSNIQLSDNNGPQMVGLMSPSALPVLGGFLTGLPTVAAINGLTLSNTSGTGTSVDIDVGSATDSTGTTTITLAKKCSVDLAGTNGPKGLDTGSPAINHTYYFFVMSAPGGAKANCIASATLQPDFSNAANYALPATGVTIAQTGTAVFPFNTVFNVTNVSAFGNPLAGVMNGDHVTSLALPSGTTVLSTGNFKAIGVSAALSSATATANSLPPGLLTGMPVAGTYINSSPMTTVASANLAGCTASCSFTLSQPATTTPSNSVLTISGGRTLTLSQNAGTTSSYTTPAALTIYPVRYRLVGALYTTGNTAPTGTIVSFVQDLDTFYLASPIMDVSTTAPVVCASSFGNTTGTTCPLSVPCGRNAACSSAITVQAFGRMVGGANSVMIYSPDQTPGTIPPNFTTAPGYSTNGGTATTTTAFPFSLYTDASGSGKIRASGVAGTGTPVYEITDGWKYHP